MTAKERRRTAFRNRTKPTEKSLKERQRWSGGGDSPFKDGFEFFKPERDKNTIRILPPTYDKVDLKEAGINTDNQDESNYGLYVWVHYGIGANRNQYLCLNQMKGQACPICEEREEALRNGDTEYAAQLKPTHRNLVWVLKRSVGEFKDPMLWLMPKAKVDDELVQRQSYTDPTDEDSIPEIFQVDDLHSGYDIIFNYTPGSGSKFAQYTGVDIARRSTPAAPAKFMKKIEDFIFDNPLTSVLKFHDYDHIASAFNATAKKQSNDSKDTHDSVDYDTSDHGKEEEEDIYTDSEDSVDEIVNSDFEELVLRAVDLGVSEEEAVRMDEEELKSKIAGLERRKAVKERLKELREKKKK